MEVATLLNMINPGKLSENTLSLRQENGNRTTAQWHRFKDEFAWLGDVRRGGRSVTGAAGIVVSGEPTLLLASNYGVKPEVFLHLRSVLQTLQALARSDTETQAKAVRQILVSSIQISHDKIRNYSINRLSPIITWLSSHSNTPNLKAGRLCPPVQIQF